MNEKIQKGFFRTFEAGGQTIIIDDFIYRRLFRDTDFLPKRKYTFIKGFLLSYTGYIRINLRNNKVITLSRYIMHAVRGELVDHINRNRLDNRRCNLRIVNARQNMLNRKVKNKTGLTGISVYTTKNKKTYVNAAFRTKEMTKTFLCRDTPFNRILAALAHDKFVLQEGEEEYAPLNFPEWQFEPMRSILMKEDLGKLKEGSKEVKRQEVRNAKNRRIKCILRFCRKRAKSSPRRTRRE